MVTKSKRSTLRSLLHPRAHITIHLRPLIISSVVAADHVSLPSNRRKHGKSRTSARRASINILLLRLTLFSSYLFNAPGPPHLAARCPKADKVQFQPNDKTPLSGFGCLLVIAQTARLLFHSIAALS